MPPSPPNSRFGGLYLSGRALAVLLVIVGVIGAMAFYRAHTTPAALWAGITHSTAQPIASGQVPTLATINHEQELLAQTIAPAVVAVNVTAKTGGRGDGMPGDEGGDGGQGQMSPDNPLSQFFGQFPRRPQYETGLGSGIIISPDGYIVTNNHVVEGATDVTVTLNNQHQYDAKVVGTDVLTDLAVIKINATGLPNLPWGDSKTIKQGDLVFAFGNPFNQLFTMTHGIVSGKGRASTDRTDLRAPQDFIQTDAAINPGNSGGPLVNFRGEVIGVNAFIYTSTGSFSGEAFAIPEEIAKPITADLIAHGRVVRGYLGINIEDITPDDAHFFDVPPDTKGALVSNVTSGDPGDKAGLKPGDVITSLNGQTVSSSSELQLATQSVPPGHQTKINILRDGKPMTLTATLGLAPEDQNPKAAASAAPAPAAGVQLGVGWDDLTPEIREQFQIPDSIKGAIVRSVTPGGPAFIAGLSRGLVVTDIDRVPVESAAAARAELAKLPPDKAVLLRIYTPGPQGGEVYLVVHPAPASGPGQ